MPHLCIINEREDNGNADSETLTTTFDIFHEIIQGKLAAAQMSAAAFSVLARDPPIERTSVTRVVAFYELVCFLKRHKNNPASASAPIAQSHQPLAPPFITRSSPTIVSPAQK